MHFSFPRRDAAGPDSGTAGPGDSDERLHDLLELACRTAGLGVFERDFRTGAGFWNEELFAIRGVTGRAGTPPFEVAASRVFEADRAHFDAAMRGSLLQRHDPVRRQTFRLRYRVHADDGSLRYLHKQWVVRYGVDGRAEHMIGVVADDTPYESLLRSHDAAVAQIDLAAEFAGIALWRQDLATGEVRLNAQAAKLFDVDARAPTIPLLRLRMAMHPDDRPAAEAADAEALQSGRPVDVEWRQRAGSGAWRRLLTRRGVQVDARGAPVMLIGVALDANAHADLDETRHAAAASGRDAQARCRFLARVGHELRTPMNAVLGFARLLSYDGAADGGAVPPARQQALARIAEAGRHLMALIDDVLDLARLEGGEMPLALAPVALEPVVASTLPMLEAPLCERRMQVTTRGLALSVLGDAGRLRQVLLNLLGNAVEYGVEGGAIGLEAELQADGICLRITHGGRGMSGAQLRPLFEPFNRLGAQRTDLEGTGLGLSITKTLIERMGGSIRVCSDAEAGSVFELTLMAADATAPG